MNGLDAYYNGLLANHQRSIDEQAYKEEEMGKLKDLIADLLEDNHPAELERLTGYDDVTCKKIVHELYMEGFNDRNCWELSAWVTSGSSSARPLQVSGSTKTGTTSGSIPNAKLTTTSRRHSNDDTMGKV